MMPLYLYLLLGSVAFPLLFSVFYLDLVKHWKNFIISTSIVAAVFLIWDAFFTHLGIWSFNEDYCIGVAILNMPIEEWLFFFVIPFCSLFLHFSIIYAFPHLSLGKSATRLVALVFIVVICVVLFKNLSKAYTVVNYSFLLLTLVVGIIFHLKLLQHFFLTFLVILIPFFLVNGILTGIATDNPIVKYDDLENLGIRIGTIPIEDIGYAFTMLFGNLIIFESLNKSKKQ